MTISCVLVWRQPKDGPTNRQATEALVSALEGLRAAARRGWSVQISALRPALDGNQRSRQTNQAADLYMTSISELKDSTFLVARQQRQVLEAGKPIEGILSKINIYQPRFNFRFEGNVFVMGDFAIKLGRALQKPSDELKGLVVEVQYRPAMDLKAGRPILEAFMQILKERTEATLPGLRESPATLWLVAWWRDTSDMDPQHHSISQQHSISQNIAAAANIGTVKFKGFN
ncbi:hypothetical protein WJX84_007018 [Apatococcus fuscideae]|uniref:Mediator of RNA polymerase II transcription subunit 20 n=1 Tax=Apatococcus fuscideae TaxID=2026836 RepID=A0AAW1RPS0_9CHLO